MNDNSLLIENQFGFKSKFSTELTSLYYSSLLTKQMDIGKIPLTIYLDLSKDNLLFTDMEASLNLVKLSFSQKKIQCALLHVVVISLIKLEDICKSKVLKLQFNLIPLGL